MPTLNEYHSATSAACALRFSKDGTKVLCTNAGDNTAGLFHVDLETGLLDKICILPISGDYPKAIAFMVQRHNVPVVREEVNGLRIISADGKDTDFLQQAGLQIHMEKTCRIVPQYR